MEWRTQAPKRRPVGFVDPCIPTLAHKPPIGSPWIHEIKHDGYRLIVCRRGGYVRLFTRSGYNWTDRYPLIRAAIAALPADATIDGEVVVCDSDGIANFERLHSREHDPQAILYACDLLELDGIDLRPLALEERKARLFGLLARLPGFNITSTSKAMVPRSSPTPASSASRASSARTARGPIGLDAPRPG
jgi:ATP-dependent DNA ligase